MSKSKVKKVKDQEVEVIEASPWYVFCSTGCGFCKKAEPVIEELNNEGYNILKLDVSEGDNAKLAQELKTEYNVQCGTPWFINADTGKGICGFREKDVVEKWLKGEDIPTPPRPTGPMPKPPFQGVSNKEELTWRKEYKKWAKENEHMPNLQSADQILERPRPKSEPPKAPSPQATDAELDTWGKAYDTWKNENSHLPNLQPVENIINNFKQRRQGGPPGAQPPVQNTQGLERRIGTLEQKLDKLMTHLGVK